MIFNLDQLSAHHRDCLLSVCEAFIMRDGNAIFGELHNALLKGGEIEVAVPIGADDEDIGQAVLFFGKLLEDDGPTARAPVNELCKLILGFLLKARELRQKQREATFN